MFHHLVIQLIGQYGYIGLFGALMLGVIGLPVPDELLMTFSGYLVSIGRLHFLMVVIVSTLGSVFGMSVSFWIGHRFGLPLLDKYGRKIHLTPERIHRSKVWFDRFGKFAVSIGYFIPGVRHLTSIYSGISKWPFHTFLLYALLGGSVWALTFTSLGFFLGEHWHIFATAFHRYSILFVTLIVVLALLLYGIRSLVLKLVKVK